MNRKQSLLLAIAALFLVLASSGTLAFEYSIQNFTNCTNTTIYVDVDALEPLADGEYELVNCTKETEPEIIPQGWACTCTGDFELVLSTAYVIKNAYLLSISSTSLTEMPPTQATEPATPPTSYEPQETPQTPRRGKRTR